MTTRLAESLCLSGVRAVPAIRIRFRRYGSAVLAKRAKKFDKVAQANKEEAKITAKRILAKLREQEAGLTKPKPPHLNEDHLWSRLDKVVTGWGKDTLAPSEDQPRSDVNTVARFNDQVFAYTASLALPVVDRRVQVLLQDGLDARVLETVLPPEPQPEVARLAHGLDKVLFNPSVQWARDPRTGTLNIDPEFENLPVVQDFGSDRLRPYVTSSRDETLVSLAKREGRRFVGSTSSLSSFLAHIYLLISNERLPDISNLSSAFADQPRAFTHAIRSSGQVKYKHYDGVYAIDSIQSRQLDKSLLVVMGTMLEKYLTHSADKFALLLRSTANVTPEELECFQKAEAYRYSKSRDFVMRSQLDAHDPRLPGSGVFDIKTRATIAIRKDPFNHEINAGYTIRSATGLFESFEREYYDLIRSGFLKYNFQTRIGDMDGVFIAYHTTQRFLGFQYIPQTEMDERLFGSPEAGDMVFKRCVQTLEHLSHEIINCFPGQDVRVAFEKDERTEHLRIYVEPDEWDEINMGERPIRKIVVSAASYQYSRHVDGPLPQFSPDWKVHLDIARANPTSADLDIAIRNELRSLREEAEKFRFWLPEGLGINSEELANWWVSLDYSGRTTIPSEGLGRVGEAPESKEGQRPLALDKKFEAELRSRADVPNVISRLRKMAVMGHMEHGRVAPFSLGFGDTTPDTASSVEASSSDPVEDKVAEQSPLDNTTSVTPHILPDQVPQDEAVDSIVLPSTASNAWLDLIASAEENSTALGQNGPIAAEIAIDNGQGTVQIDSPSPLLTAEEGGPDPMSSAVETAEVKKPNNLSSTFQDHP